jgi:hypothetical protein
MDKKGFEVAKGVMLVGEWDHAVMYRVACDCKDPEHDVTIEMEFDKRLGMIFLQLHKDVEYCHYDIDASASEKLRNYWRTIKAAFRLVFTGYLKTSTEFLLQDPDHIDSFIAALMRGRTFCAEKLEEFKKQQEEEKDLGS